MALRQLHSPGWSRAPRRTAGAGAQETAERYQHTDDREAHLLEAVPWPSFDLPFRFFGLLSEPDEPSIKNLVSVWTLTRPLPHVQGVNPGYHRYRTALYCYVLHCTEYGTGYGACGSPTPHGGCN